jgi:hypothetical protein
MMENIKKFVEFGEMTLKSIITFLYGIGCIIIIYKAYLWGKSIYLTSFYQKQINDFQNGWLTFETVNNLPLAILGFVVYFIIIAVVWKLVCELLYIIFERIGRK